MARKRERKGRSGVILHGGLPGPGMIRREFPTLGKALRFAQRQGFKAPLFLDRITRRILNPGRSVL